MQAIKYDRNRAHIGLAIDNSSSTRGNTAYVKSVNEVIRAVKSVVNTPYLTLSLFNTSYQPLKRVEIASDVSEFSVNNWQSRGGTDQWACGIVPLLEDMSRFDGDKPAKEGDGYYSPDGSWVPHPDGLPEPAWNKESLEALSSIETYNEKSGHYDHSEPDDSKPIWQPKSPTLVIVVNDGGIFEAPGQEMGWQELGDEDKGNKLRMGLYNKFNEAGWLTMLHVTPNMYEGEGYRGPMVGGLGDPYNRLHGPDSQIFEDYRKVILERRLRLHKEGIPAAYLPRMSSWNDVFRNNEIVYWLDSRSYGKYGYEYDPAFDGIIAKEKKILKDVPKLDGLSPLVAAAIGEWGRKVNRIMLKGQTPKPINLFDGDDGRSL
jgi:hypothetical protein